MKPTPSPRPRRGSPKGTLILPVILIALGSGWLLTRLGVVPGIEWAWTLGLAAVGLLAFVVSGFDKVSVVLGPLFIAASILSYLRQGDKLPIDLELPILIVLCGVLLLVARSSAIPVPAWLGPPLN